MIEQIKSATSLSEIQELLKLIDGLYVDNEEDYYVKNILMMWRMGVLQEKLKDLDKPDMAQRIDDVNINQSCGDICGDIIKIILDQQGEISSSSNDTNRSFWGDFIEYLLTHPGTRHI